MFIRLIGMKKLILINAIVWAALILVGSYLFRGHENWNYFFIFWISGFTIINSMLSSLAKKTKKDCSDLKSC